MASINQQNAVVYIGAASPLFQYAPTRNGPIGSSWLSSRGQGSQGSGGGMICAGPSTFAVQLDNIYSHAPTRSSLTPVTQIRFIWSTSSRYIISVGLDGTLQSGQSKDGVTLSATVGYHTVRLEVVCESCGTGDIFTLQGVEVIPPSQGGSNATLDDSASQITYSGFESTNSKSSDIPAIRQGLFYRDTVSYTSKSGSSASFGFTGSSIFIFGPTGPEFGVFSISLDNSPMGSYNSSTTFPTTNTLLFWQAGLSDSSHTITLTSNQDDRIVAIDYMVATSTSYSATNNPNGPISPGGGVTTVVGGTTTVIATDGGGAAPTAVFPTQAGQTGNQGNNGAAGLAIGLSIGIIALLFLIWMWWRWRAWKKAGGEGNFLVALCGPRDRPAKPVSKPEKFALWPMLSYKPKYAT